MISREAPVAEPVAERRSLFSFAGSAAIAAGVAVMVITGVQVFNGTDTGVPSLNGSGAELASGASGLQGGAVHQVSHPLVVCLGIQRYNFDIIHEGPPLF